MYTERPDNMSQNAWMAQRVVGLSETLNGASGAMKMTPFFVANNQAQLLEQLDLFAGDIAEAAGTLKRLVPTTVEFDREASGTEVVATMLLQTPDESQVRQTFDRARMAISVSLHAMRDAAKQDASIPVELGADAMMNMNALHNVVRGTQEFYRRVPSEAKQGFIFR